MRNVFVCMTERDMGADGEIRVCREVGEKKRNPRDERIDVFQKERGSDVLLILLQTDAQILFGCVSSVSRKTRGVVTVAV